MANEAKSLPWKWILLASGSLCLFSFCGVGSVGWWLLWHESSARPTEPVKTQDAAETADANLDERLHDALGREVREILGKADAEIDCTVIGTDFWDKKHQRLPGIKIPSISALWIYHQEEETDLVIWLLPDGDGFLRVKQLLRTPHAGTVADLETCNRRFQEGMDKARKQSPFGNWNPKW